MPWSLADFSNKLTVGVVGEGARVINTTTGFTDIKNDGSWMYSVGQANVDSGDPTYVDPLGTSSYPNGFDGYKYPTVPPGFSPLYQNLAVNLFPFNNKLYGGMICQYIPEYGIPANISELLGSQIWKTSDLVTWTQVTNNGFGDANIINFEGFAAFDGKLYVSGSKGASSTPSGLGGAKVFRLVAAEPPTVIDLVRFEAKGKLARIFLKWETASESDTAGFNIYRSESPEGPFDDNSKINSALIPAKGSVTEGAAYKFVDWKVEKNKTYYYKLGDVDISGKLEQHGPVSAKARFLLKGKGPFKAR
jgi:hypothetical protein